MDPNHMEEADSYCYGLLAVRINNQSTDTKRGVALATLNMLRQCGTLLGTRVFPSAENS
ncbi:hypothetical protein GE09DRAFT_1164150 [Coniochaeta sp. 2T2.1]|nr:hypothetical protein GE09DRAFT_1164150 [Coniochaeta sp. 2T2.1]